MKKVLITGTGRGIGWITAEKFLNEGYYVIGTSTTGQSPVKHANFECHQLQLTSEFSVESVPQDIILKHPQIDIFISNAGFAQDEPTGIELAVLRKSLDVNIVGTISFAQNIVKNVVNGGRVIILGSIMGSISRTQETDFPSYRISKAGLHMYAKLLSLQLADRNISVVALHPGWVKTDMGGQDAPKTAAKAADELFTLATTQNINTGTFWNETVEEAW